MIGTNRIISTYRLINATSPDNTTSYSANATLSSISVYIESAKAELSLVLGVQPGLEIYQMIGDPLDLTDIRVTDKVVDDKGNIFFVHGIKRFEDNDDIENSLEIVLTKKVQRYTD